MTIPNEWNLNPSTYYEVVAGTWSMLPLNFSCCQITIFSSRCCFKWKQIRLLSRYQICTLASSVYVCERSQATSSKSECCKGNKPGCTHLPASRDVDGPWPPSRLQRYGSWCRTVCSIKAIAQAPREMLGRIDGKTKVKRVSLDRLCRGRGSKECHANRVLGWWRHHFRGAGWGVCGASWPKNGEVALPSRARKSSSQSSIFIAMSWGSIVSAHVRDSVLFGYPRSSTLSQSFSWLPTSGWIYVQSIPSRQRITNYPYCWYGFG